VEYSVFAADINWYVDTPEHHPLLGKLRKHPLVIPG
jgi:hypothetical protein